MAERIELTLRPKEDVPPLDEETAERLRGVARADTVQLGEAGAVFGFPSSGDPAAVRGNVELAARFVLGAHWHTRYELVNRGADQ
jgi:hypothetical protein